MSYENQASMAFPVPAAEAVDVERAAFIKRTYLHVAGAILAFIGLEVVLLNAPFTERLAMSLITGYAPLIMLGGFMLVSVLANRWAMSSTSRGVQYLGLVVYVAFEAVFFVPMLYFARQWAPDVIPKAGIVTMVLFTAITVGAFVSGKDFSFLRTIITVGGIVALGIIVASFIFGFTLGIVFSGAMILFAAVCILYSTSNIIRHYHTQQHVAAALSLFASVALMFWYVLQFMLHFAGDD